MKNLVIKKLSFIILFFVLLSCTKSNLSQRGPASISPVLHFEKIFSGPMTVKILDDQGRDKLVSLSFKYVGSLGVREDIDSNKELIKDLIRTNLASSKYSELREEKGKKEVQKKILGSLSSFVNEGFVRVDIVELREM